ncbi:MAG: metallophosphoesterase [Clostridia bacterium]|nr:metallophosphoesterase [Clostridia bacterium]
MAIFAISDLHLSLSGEKPMDVFGSRWENYTERMEVQWNRVVKPEDLVLIPGDISWAMYLEETKTDFTYLNRLPGQKLLLRGNHDYWWTTLNKMEKYVAEQGFDTLHFLKNTAFLWEDTAICGTRGWTIPHPDSNGEDKKIYERERQRLLLSLEAAAAQKPSQILCAMHYPPVDTDGITPGFLDIMEQYGVEECIFGHLHAAAHRFAPQGIWQGVKLKLVACDYLDFTPMLIQ